MNQRQTVTKCVPSAMPRLLRVWGRKRKVFLIVWQVRGSGSDILHDQIRVVFGELLAGYLSWLSIPLLGLGLCVGMIRGWTWGGEGGVDMWRVINVDVSTSLSSSAPPPGMRNDTWGRQNGPTCSPGSLRWV